MLILLSQHGSGYSAIVLEDKIYCSYFIMLPIKEIVRLKP